MKSKKPHKLSLRKEYLRFLKNKAHDAIKQYFDIREFTLRDTELTGRVINHWASYGLLPEHRVENGKGWRNFSIIDLIWIRILIELREIGFGLEKLKISYKSIFEDNTTKNKISLFEFAVFSVLFNEEPIFLLVSTNDGKIDIINSKDFIHNLLNNNNIQNFIHINLRACMEKVKPDADYFSNLPLSNFAQEVCNDVK